jgi:hypothetical protein
MAITKEFATGTIIVVTAKASISSGDANLLEYTWRRNGNIISTLLTADTATLLTTTAGVYDVIVSHPNADPVTSNTFTITLRDPQDILRLVYHSNGTGTTSDGSFTNPVVLDWNIATQQYEFGPDANNGFGTPSSGWWRVFAKEKDISLDITLRGSSGAGTNPGQGGVGTLSRVFERGQIYSFRVGDDNYGSQPDVSLNGPNGGRTRTGGGFPGGGPTYIKRGGTLVAVVGGGGGSSSSGVKGGDGGGFNVGGENGSGSNGGAGARVVTPGNFVNVSNYTQANVTRTMTRCNLVSASSGQLSCDVELTADDLQNNGAFAFNNGGAGGSGVTGGYSGSSSNGGGGGGSGWAGSVVTVLSTTLGGNPQGKRGSVRIRKTGFVNYIASWYHTTGVRAGFIPVFNVSNTGNFIATIIPENEGTASTAYNQLPENHYLIKFQEPFPNNNYTVEFTFISTTIAGVSSLILPNMRVSQITKETNQCRVWFTGDGSGNVHIREAAFRIY